jgi:hypothetical protein
VLQALLGFEGAKYLGGGHRAFRPVADVPLGTLEQHMVRKKTGSPARAARGIRSQPPNPNNDPIRSQRGGGTPSPALDKAARDLRSRQLDPENDAYWASRGVTKPACG